MKRLFASLLPLFSADGAPAGAAPAPAAAAPAEGAGAGAAPAAEPAPKRSDYGTVPTRRTRTLDPGPAREAAAPQGEAPLVAKQAAQAAQGAPQDAAEPKAAEEAAPEPEAQEGATDAAQEAAPATPAFEGGEEFLAALRRQVPGLPVNSLDEIPDYLVEVREKAVGVDAIAKLARDYDPLGQFFRAVEGGLDPRVAAREAFAEDALAPDPDADPAAYRAHVERQAILKADQHIASSESQRAQKQREALSRQAEATFAATADRLAANDPAFDRSRFTQEVMSIFDGDSVTGRFRGDAFEVIHRGLQHEALVAQAVEQARAEEREKVLAEVRGPRPQATDDAPLAIGGSGAGMNGVDPANLTPQERQSMRLQQRLGISGRRAPSHDYA